MGCIQTFMSGNKSWIHWGITNSKHLYLNIQHSTISAVTLVVNDYFLFDKREHCATVFIALTKAFYPVALCLLFHLLFDIQFDSALRRWFQNDPSKRLQCTKARNIQSQFKSLTLFLPVCTIKLSLQRLQSSHPVCN